MDPCDLRLKSGDGALRDLVARRTPLFEFAIRTALADHNLDSAEGRVSAPRRCVPMVAKIKESTLREEHARQLAGWVGWDDVARSSDGCGRRLAGPQVAATGGGRRRQTRPGARSRPRRWCRGPTLDPTLRLSARRPSALQYR
jgi:DNA primase